MTKIKALSLPTILLLLLSCSPKLPHSAVLRRAESELAKYRANLRLEVLPDRRQVMPGEILKVNFTLTNIGSEDLEPCLAARGAIHFWELDKRYIELADAETVDHPFCERPLQVPAGKTISWSKEINVPPLPRSTAKLTASVYLVYPRECGPYGCYGLLLSAEDSPIAILDTNGHSISH